MENRQMEKQKNSKTGKFKNRLKGDSQEIDLDMNSENIQNQTG